MARHKNHRVTVQHPQLGTTVEVRLKQAKVMEKSGWQISEPQTPAAPPAPPAAGVSAGTKKEG